MRPFYIIFAGINGAGKTNISRISKAIKLGYRVIMNYVGVSSVNVAHSRIEHRVRCGGHNIDKTLVASRWVKSLENFKLAKDLCDEVHVYDNTITLKEVAGWNKGVLCWWGVNSLQGKWLSDFLIKEN